MGNALARRGLRGRGAVAVLAWAWVLTATVSAQTLVGPRQSSAIALSRNEQFLVNVNPDSNSLSIFAFVTQPRATGLAKFGEVAVGRCPESVAIHPNSRTCYVANALDGTVSVVDLLLRRVTKTFAVGVEPTAVVVSPNGSRLYVANASSNTLQVVNAADCSTVAVVDLSPHGTSPRALAVTNDGDGDDTDETIFVPLFFAQLRPGKTSTQEGEDDQREGRVVAVSAATNTVLGTTVLGPQANTGFNSNGKLAPGTGLVPAIASTNPQTFTTPTGAFPNQLAGLAIHPTKPAAYVVSTGASPNGPLRFNHMAQGLISVFNTATRAEITAGQTDPSVRRTAPLNLNQGVNLATTPAPRLFMTNPVALTWRPDGSDAWVVVQNSDLIARVTVDAACIPSAGLPLVAGPSQLVRVDLANPPAGQIAGTAPRGLVINGAGTKAFVYCFTSRSITTVNIGNPTAPVIEATNRATALPAPNSLDAVALQGATLFFSGRGPQERMSSESWGGCIVCHPNGRSDNVTWMFDAGPRQTIPLDGMFSKTNPNDQRILNWSAVRDENHDFELNTRGVFGGRGLIDDDRLFYAFGGASGATPTDSAAIQQFHQLTGAVGTTNDLANGAALPSLSGFTPRRDFGTATLDDGRVFLIGGRSGSGPGSLVGAGDAVLEFNPRTNVLRRRSSVGFTPRHSLGAAAVKTSGGVRVYAIGGYNSTSSTSSPVNTVEEYNPASDTWRTVASLPTASAQFGVSVAGGVNTAEPRQLIHVASGNTGSESTPVVPATFSVQRFQADPAGPGVWSTFSVTGLTPRRKHGAATALRGVSSRIFVVGGINAAGTVLDSVEEYIAQAVTAVATPHTALPAARACFGISSSLSTNQIYVIGGQGSTGADQTTVFEYTVANNGPVAGPPGTPSGSWVTRANLPSGLRGLGVNVPPGVTNFLTVQSKGRDARQDSIAVWIAQKVRSARAPVAASHPDAVAGRALFSAANCQSCHGGSKWTRSIVDYVAPPSPDDNLGLGNEKVIGAELRKTGSQGAVLVNVGTFEANGGAGGRTNEIRFNGADISQAIAPLGANGFNIPSLLSVHETAPYFYSGLAQTLDEVLLNVTHRSAGTGGVDTLTNAADRTKVVQFLRSIDQNTPIFP